MRKRIRALAGAFVLFFLAGLCGRAADEPFAITVPVLSTPPNINGTIDDSWSKATQAPVLFDFTYQRPGEPTTVYVAQDASALDVAFAVTQKEAITAGQETNSGGVGNDDNVTVALWPQGAAGFSYTFSANAAGARYQTSSENTAYTPQWTAVARRTASGYTVTMRIPFDIIRSGGSRNWKVQFERMTVATNGMEVWEHVQGQRNAGDPAFAGTLTGMLSTGGRIARPKPRIQIYALGEGAPASIGGSTSRIGADFAIPVTLTSSFLGSFHPDQSNLEVDQQTIAPTAYARRFTEVRPFFTQAATNFNNTFSCTNCPTTLYTPSIPQYREGYAYEGTAGPFSYAAFDAIGTQRSDAAQVLTYALNNAQRIAQVSLQRVAVDTPSLHDDTSTITGGYLNQRTHLFAYFNGGADRGTNVPQRGFADYFEYGGGFVNQTTTLAFTFQKIGAYFNPVDGYVAQPDVAGYFLVFNKTVTFPKSSLFHDISLNSFYGRYHNRSGVTNQTNGGGQVNFDFKNLVALHVFLQSSGIEPNYDDLPGAPVATAYELLPFNTNGFYLGYKTQTTTPTYIQYSGGRYFHGHLTSWSYLTTIPLRRRMRLTLEADRNSYAPIAAWEPNWQLALGREPPATQWLERASLDWQLSRDASVDIGVRRIIGRNIPNAVQFPDLPAPAPGAPCSLIVVPASEPSQSLLQSVRLRQRRQRQLRLPPLGAAERVLRRLRQPKQLSDLSRALPQMDPVYRSAKRHVIIRAQCAWRRSQL